MLLLFKLIDVEIRRVYPPLTFLSGPQPRHGLLRNDNALGLSRCDRWRTSRSDDVTVARKIRSRKALDGQPSSAARSTIRGLLMHWRAV